jgi:hypothetical protein
LILSQPKNSAGHTLITTAPPIARQSHQHEPGSYLFFASLPFEPIEKSAEVLGHVDVGLPE